MTALVDVGIPTARRPGYLAEAVESVLAQSYGDWRLRVAQDGTDPHAAGALRRFLEDPRIEHCTHPAPIGAARNMNFLLAVGDAPFVALLHDDDRWAPGFLAAAVAFLEAHPGAAFVFCGNREIDAAGRVTGESPLWLAEGAYPSEHMVPIMLRRNRIGAPSAVVLRRSALEAVGGGFDTSFEVMYDHELWLRLALAFPVGYLRRHDADYRIHGAQSSRMALRGRADEHLRLLDHVERLAGERRPALRLDPREGRRLRARRWLTKALDAAQDGDAAAARAGLRRAVGLHHSAALDSRVPATLFALAAGRPGRALVGRARRLALDGRVRPHLWVD